MIQFNQLVRKLSSTQERRSFAWKPERRINGRKSVGIYDTGNQGGRWSIKSFISSYLVESQLLVHGSHSRHKWKALGVRAQAVKGIRRESYVEQFGQSVEEKSLSMGAEDHGVREKNEVSARRQSVVLVESHRSQRA